MGGIPYKGVDIPHPPPMRETGESITTHVGVQKAIDIT